MRLALALGLVAAIGGPAPESRTPSRRPPATPSPTATRRPAGTSTPRPAGPRLDFSGVWALDEKASRNVSPPMRDAVLTVRQSGDQIWISPADPSKSHLLAESIVADGRAYEKTLGNKGRGFLTVDWAKDGQALWLEMTAGPEENPKQVVQRSVWKVSKDRRVWVRQSVSIQDGKTQQSMLVFRRRTTVPTAAPKR